MAHHLLTFYMLSSFWSSYFYRFVLCITTIIVCSSLVISVYNTLTTIKKMSVFKSTRGVNEIQIIYMSQYTVWLMSPPKYWWSIFWPRTFRACALSCLRLLINIRHFCFQAGSPRITMSRKQWRIYAWSTLGPDFRIQCKYIIIPVSYTHLTLPTNREV